MSTTTRTYRVGDKVTPDPDSFGVPPTTLGRVFTVAKVNPRNLRCTADDGGRGINFPASILLPATEENVAKSNAPRPYVPVEFFTTGEIVTVKTAGKIPVDQPMVVLKHDGGDKVNITQLGGDGDRYWRWPAKSLIKRDLEWLTERLMED